MKRFSAVLFVLLPLSLFAQNYVQTITTANMDSASNKVANLQSCFGTDDTALFDELYILGRTWQEKQWDNYYSTTSISLADFDALPAEEKELPANVEYVPDADGAWVKGTIARYRYREIKIRQRQVYKNLIGTCFLGKYRRVDDEVLSTIDYPTNEPSKPANVNENGIWILDTKASAGCDQNDKIREVIKYVWLNPDESENNGSVPQVFEYITGDTLGVLVQCKNINEFNLSNGYGELRPYNSAMERISATEIATIEGALGAGNERQGEWYVDEVEDNVFLDGRSGVYYTVMSYLKEGTYTCNNKPYTYTSFKQKVNGVASYTAKMWEYNNLPQKREGVAQFRTPCYVYKKSGNSYVFERVFDATKECIGKVTTAGKKIYLTGRCISFNAKNPATNTSKIEEEIGASVGYDGPGFITIDCSGTTDLYIENLELQTTPPENKAEEVLNIDDILLWGQPIPSRISAPIVLQKAGNITNIHIKGRNLLMGSHGCNLYVDAVVAKKRANMHGAALYINVDERSAVNCTFDDKWPTSLSTTESAYLKLVGEQDPNFEVPERANRQASPIYIGNDNCTVTFDGGEYCFTPADANEGATSNNMIAAMRKYEQMGQTVRNVGSCSGVGKLHFKSGTFSMTSMAKHINLVLTSDKQTVISDGTNLMRIPSKSVIDGGTFNDCIVRRFSGAGSDMECVKNSSGDDLFEFKVTGILNENGFLDNLQVPSGGDISGYDFTACIPLKDEEGTYYYSAYLPGSGDCGVMMLIQNWDVGFPSGLNEMIKHEDRLLYMNEKDGDFLGTKYLALLELNPKYPEASASNTYVNSHILEENDYQIMDNVYLMTWSMSDKWRIITLPFDVSDVYVLETWATDDNGETADANKEFQYYVLAAQQLVIGGNLDKLDEGYGANLDFMGIYNKAVATTAGQVSEEAWRVVRKPYKMTYWREYGIDKPANYYLYEAKGNNAKAIGLGSQFERVWEAVPRHDKDGNSIIMEKGKTYAIMFPNWVSERESGWNYWDGKYILFEGPGQTLSGTNSFTDVTAPINDNEFQFGGNPTLGFVTPGHSPIYTWDFEKQEFVRGETKQMSWLDSYMVANDATTRQLAKIGRRGNPSYDTSTDNRLQGATPLALEVYSIEGGLRFYAYVDQELTLIDMMGRVVASLNLSSNSSQDIQLPTGVYVVRSSQMEQMMKVMVK